MSARVVLFTCLCLLVISLCMSNRTYNPEWEVEFDELNRRLLHYQAIPSIISSAPRTWVNVSWPTGYTARIGNKLPWESVMEKPILKYPSNDSTYFTILFTDYDDTVNYHKIMKEYQLWFVVNIPGMQIDKGEEHIPYIQPKVKSGHHRILVSVFRQLEKVNMTGHEFAYPERNFFCAMEVLHEIESRLHAATVYLVGAPGAHNSTTSERPRPLE